jgi:uncharacterized protein YndB with AHSA1/START domain
VAGKTLTIRQSYYLRAPVKKVFRALTEPTKITKWFVGEARLDPRRGGTYRFTWLGGYRHGGKVLEFIKNRRLALEWPTPRLGKTRVTFTVRPRGKGTQLRVVHSGYKTTPAWLEMYGGTQSGWAYYLMNLKSVLEHGNDLRSLRDSE